MKILQFVKKSSSSIIQEFNTEVISLDSFKQKRDQPKMISNFFHLQGYDRQRNLDVANLFSQVSHLPIISISETTIKSYQDIMSLSDKILLIEDAENLTEVQQKVILGHFYHHIQHEIGLPIIITTSTKSIKEMRQEKTLNQPMIDEMDVNLFQVDRAPKSLSSLKSLIKELYIKDPNQPEIYCGNDHF